MPISIPTITPRIAPPLDPAFLPLALTQRAFRQAVAASAHREPFVLALERSDGGISRYATEIFSADHPRAGDNIPYVERLVKTLLWARGGGKIYLGGARAVGEAIARLYLPDGARAFDADIMGRIYEREFAVVPCDIAAVPAANESCLVLGGHLDGCRIGFDAGASDRKVAAVRDGQVIYSEEVVWDPRPQTDPQYHFEEIMAALRSAAAHLPRVDAIGVSSAGVYVNNRVRAASLFRGITPELFEARVKNLFLEVQQAWGNMPLQVINDGDVTALAGAMSLHDGAVIGVAMGSSEAGGYVTPDGKLTSWLNELAFVPVDANPQAPADEWSGDIGCGVQYFSQQAVGRLIPAAGLTLAPRLGLPEQLHAVQDLMSRGDERVRLIYETIGVYLGYGLAYYAEFYPIRHALILGRVMSGEGGNMILRQARAVLEAEFPELAATLQLHLPDESDRRVGQAIAAASLPDARVGSCE